MKLCQKATYLGCRTEQSDHSAEGSHQQVDRLQDQFTSRCHSHSGAVSRNRLGFIQQERSSAKRQRFHVHKLKIKKEHLAQSACVSGSDYKDLAGKAGDIHQILRPLQTRALSLLNLPACYKVRRLTHNVKAVFCSVTFFLASEA